jgi:hypothetical protein
MLDKVKTLSYNVKQKELRGIAYIAHGEVRGEFTVFFMKG